MAKRGEGQDAGALALGGGDGVGVGAADVGTVVAVGVESAAEFGHEGLGGLYRQEADGSVVLVHRTAQTNPVA